MHKLAPRVLSSLILIALTACDASSLAQGTREDYRRADIILHSRRDKIFRQHVDAKWLDDGKHFWYRVGIAPQRYEFVFVDATQGTRSVAFDHKALAEALSQATGEWFGPDHLPLRSLTFGDDRSQLSFNAAGSRWNWNRTDSKLTKADTATQQQTTVKVLARPEPTRHTGRETRIDFENLTEQAVQLFWIDGEGRHSARGGAPAGQSCSRQTYADHVWIVKNEAGESLGVFQATRSPGVAVIDGTKPQRRKRFGDASIGARRPMASGAQRCETTTLW